MPLPQPELGLVVHYGFVGAAPIAALLPMQEKIVLACDRLGFVGRAGIR